MKTMARLEISTQALEPVGDTVVSEASSRPLVELAAAAPSYDTEECYRVAFSFSNDECAAPYFHHLQMRQFSPDFRSASNRIALLVGESSLAACLQFIPEETIVLLDQSPLMCEHMNNYTVWLQYASSLDDWRHHVLRENYVPPSLRRQIREWGALGHAHPLGDEATFQATQQLARQKVFVPWRADLTKTSDMAELAAALNSIDAHITLINLTNVIQYAGYHHKVELFANNLRQLPVTQFAPILTTSTHATTPNMPGLATTGPFFGLDNLAGDGAKPAAGYLGAAIVRHYYYPEAEWLQHTA